MSRKIAVQKAINALLKQTYFDRIPLDSMFNAIRENGGEVVQEDLTIWSGLLLGHDGEAMLKIANVKGLHYLRISWHEMPSGRFEVIGYVT